MRSGTPATPPQPAAQRCRVNYRNVELRGIDVFVDWPSRDPNSLAEVVGKLAGDGLRLQMIDNRGVKVWPAGLRGDLLHGQFPLPLPVR